MDLAERLGAIPLFESVSKEDLDALACIVKERAFPRGTTLFSEGDRAAGFFVVLSGRVKVFKLSPEGKEQILHFFGPPQPVGEAAVFAGERFPAHAVAEEDSELLFFPREEFFELIRQRPALALGMLAVLSRRLRQFAGLIEDLSLKEVPARLARHLLYLGQTQKGETVRLDMAKGQLAGLLGATPETLSRILGRLARAGAIEMADSRRIRLVDQAYLERLAHGGVKLG